MSSSAILFHNPEKTVILLDLPLSIALAQHSQSQNTTRQLLSSKPLIAPYASNEPKSAKARQKVLAQTSESDKQYHAEIQSLIRQGLQFVGSHYAGPWCLERRVIEDPRVTYFSQDESLRRGAALQTHQANVSPPIVLSCPVTEFPNIDSLRDTMVMNLNGEETNLKISETPGLSFHVPPMSAFLLSDVTCTERNFSTMVDSIWTRSAPGRESTDVFNLIVVDPPWTNRSVRRSHHYSTSEDQAHDPFEAILFIFEKQVAIDGVVAIWITNKESIRTDVMGKLQKRGLQLFEEWIWVKVTEFGEPVTDLEGLWKHPYEICLIFCDRLDGISLPSYHPRRRILAASPDLHSRKPSLKEVMALVFPHLTLHCGLEIFARHLTAGWISWGNEVLRDANECGWSTKTD